SFAGSKIRGSSGLRRDDDETGSKFSLTPCGFLERNERNRFCADENPVQLLFRDQPLPEARHQLILIKILSDLDHAVSQTLFPYQGIGCLCVKGHPNASLTPVTLPCLIADTYGLVKTNNPMPLMAYLSILFDEALNTLPDSLSALRELVDLSLYKRCLHDQLPELIQLALVTLASQLTHLRPASPGLIRVDRLALLGRTLKYLKS